MSDTEANNPTAGFPPPRFEFRTFARNHTGVEQRLRQFTRPRHIREASDIYLMSASNTRNNIKIRDGVLDIKVLVSREQDLEQWQPRLKRSFPLERDLLLQQLFPSLNTIPVPLPRPHYTQKELLDEVLRPHPELVIANVFKRRFGFDLDPVSAEFVELWVNGAGLQSVALESPQTGAIMKLRRRLGLEQAENTNYLLAIKRIIGMAPLSRDAY